jgi:hypothetical protein
MDSLDQWLERELRNADTASGSTVPVPRYATLEPSRHRSRLMRLIAGLGATKAALAASAAVALAAGGIVTGKAVTTGDPNPFDSNWGSTVTQQVQTCKADPTQHEHGIGQCVSSTAKTHGDTVSGEHSHGQNGAAPPTGTPSPHPTGAPPSLPGAATNHPTASPSVTLPTSVPTLAPAPALPSGPVHPTGPPSVVPPPHP